MRYMFSFLGLLFSGLLMWLLNLQIPAEFGFFDLLQSTDDLALLLVQSYTLPRVVMALLAGGLLSFSSLLLQQVMANPLASDNTLGISSGAQFALFVMSIFAPSFLQQGASLIALLGAMLSLLLVITLAIRKTMSPLLLILAGLVVNLYLGSFSTLMTLFYPEESRGLAQWGAGSLMQESWCDTIALLIRAIPAIAIIAVLLRPLNILSLNDSNAQSLGKKVGRLRLIGIFIATFLIAAVVSTVGMIGFVGLVSATLVHQLGVRTLKGQLPCAFAIGALLLAITDLALQLLTHYQNLNLPTGAVTSLLGTPLFLWLMFRALPSTVHQPKETSQKLHQFRPHFVALLIGALALSIFSAIFIGQGLNGWNLLDLTHRWDWQLFELRTPRVSVALSAGILLALAGVILQRLTLNPMASPELLGVSSGASMGVLALLFLFSNYITEWLWFAGILGALITLFVLVIINQRNSILPEKVLLIGISSSALFDTLQRIVIASGDPRANLLIEWTSGSTQNTNPDFALCFLMISLALLGMSFIFGRWLEILTLQPAVAQAVGLNIKRARWLLILFSAILTALATLIIGPLSFIGLLAPQITKCLGLKKARNQLFISACLGALIMVFADWLGRQILFPYEVPAGLVVTLIGGTYFLLMVRKI